MPGCRACSSRRASTCSLARANPSSAAPARARMPHSISAISRSCGPPPAGPPNAAALTAVPGTSIPVPSQATTRSPNANAPGAPAAASGPRSRSNSSSNGFEPSRCRARHSAAADGTPSPARCRTPCVSDRITDRYPGGPALSSPLNRHKPSTKYTTARAGSSRARFSRHPARSTTSSTSRGPISQVRTPRPGTPRPAGTPAEPGAGMTH
jgi:hypothetical protein